MDGRMNRRADGHLHITYFSIIFIKILINLFGMLQYESYKVVFVYCRDIKVLRLFCIDIFCLNFVSTLRGTELEGKQKYNSLGNTNTKW